MNTAARPLGAASGILALVSVIISCPKRVARGEVRGRGGKSSADAKVALNQEALRSAAEALAESKLATQECHNEMREVKDASWRMLEDFEGSWPTTPPSPR